MHRSSLRRRADEIKPYRCKNLIAVIEDPRDIKNIGTVIRNVNALGVEKAYVVDPRCLGGAPRKISFAAGTWATSTESNKQSKDNDNQVSPGF